MPPVFKIPERLSWLNMHMRHVHTEVGQVLAAEEPVVALGLTAISRQLVRECADKASPEAMCTGWRGSKSQSA